MNEHANTSVYPLRVEGELDIGKCWRGGTSFLRNSCDVSAGGTDSLGGRRIRRARRRREGDRAAAPRCLAVNRHLTVAAARAVGDGAVRLSRVHGAGRDAVVPRRRMTADAR
jgi:hypothetical protein